MVDVTVRGAGVLGLTAAWAMAEKGARVRVIDPAGPGAGASGGLLGALAPHSPDAWSEVKQFQLDALLAASDFWTGVEAASGLKTGYARLGRIQPLPDDAAVHRARHRAADAARHWRGFAMWEVVQVPDDEWTPPTATGLILRDSLSARINPRAALAALVAAIRAKGGEVVSDGAEQGAVLWATGVAGLVDLSRCFGRAVGDGVRGQAALLDCNVRDQPQLFSGGLHVVPHADGTVAVGSTSEPGAALSGEPDAGLERLIATVRVCVPALAAAPVVARWAGVRPRAITRAPLLGPWPGRPGHFVANGGFKIGFGLAPGIAPLTASLILEGRDEVPQAFRVESALG